MNHILISRDFRLIGRRGEQLVGQYIIIKQLSYDDGFPTKLGITVSKRFGKSHERNRFKRLCREAFRLSLPDLPKGLMINIKPGTYAKKAKMQDIQNEFRSLLLY